jgi:4-amino-4-deoxy-L-arabinose transferase-like glycosyltransferase
MSTFSVRFNSMTVHGFILFCLALPYCVNLGKSSIWDANEAFYAETPREMLQSGDYIAPHFNFRPRVQKPPLTYWAVLLSYKAFGVNEFAVRVPGAAAAIGVILFSYFSAGLLFSKKAGLAAAAIVASSPRIFILARRLPIDILLLFFFAGALYFVIRAIKMEDSRSWAFAYLFSALGFLTKGPIAVFIPAASYLLWACWSRRIGKINPRILRGVLLFLCVAAPWYILIFHKHGWDYISPFFLKDNLGRFASESFGPSRGYSYYFSVFFADFFPWSLLAAAAVYYLWRARKTDKPLKTLEYGFPLFWCAVNFILFTFSKNKQEYYIAPMYPAAAIIISGVLDRFFTSASARNRSRVVRLWTVFACLLLIIAIVSPQALSAFVPNLNAAFIYGPSVLLVVGFGLFILETRRRHFGISFASFVAPLWFLYFTCALTCLPVLEQFRPVKKFCAVIENAAGEDYEAGFFNTALPSMVYYLRRPIFEEYGYEEMSRRFKSDKRIFCILNKEDFDYFAAQKDLAIFIVDRNQRFSARLGALLNVGHFAGAELILASNRPSGNNAQKGSPTS